MNVRLLELLLACLLVLVGLQITLARLAPSVHEARDAVERKGSLPPPRPELLASDVLQDRAARAGQGAGDASAEMHAKRPAQESEPLVATNEGSEPLVAFLNRDNITIHRAGGLYEIGLVELPSDGARPRQVHLWGVVTGEAPALLTTTSVFDWEHSPVFITQSDLSAYDELFVTTEAWHEDPARILTALTRRDKQKPAVDPFCPTTASVPCPVVSYELMPNGTFARLESLLEPGATRPCPAVCAF